MKRIQPKNGMSSLHFYSLEIFPPLHPSATFHPPIQLAVYPYSKLINPDPGLSPKTPPGKTPPPPPSPLPTMPSPPNSTLKSNPSAVSNQTASSSKESKFFNKSSPSSSTTSTDPISALASATAAPKTASDLVPAASAVPTLVKPVRTLLGEMALLHPFWAAGKAEGVFGEAPPHLMGLRRMGRTGGLSDSIPTMMNSTCLV